MTIHVYTSFTFSYLSRARVLAESLRKHHPDWVIWAGITDLPPEGFDFDLAGEPFDRVLWTHEIFGETTEGWLFGHDIVEACTAVKGRMLQLLLDEPDCEQVFYLDPDIAVFAPLNPMVEALRTPGSSILLTPHQLVPKDSAASPILEKTEPKTTSPDPHKNDPPPVYSRGCESAAARAFGALHP